MLCPRTGGDGGPGSGVEPETGAATPGICVVALGADAKKLVPRRLVNSAVKPEICVGSETMVDPWVGDSPWKGLVEVPGRGGHRERH